MNAEKVHSSLSHNMNSNRCKLVHK